MVLSIVTIMKTKKSEAQVGLQMYDQRNKHVAWLGNDRNTNKIWKGTDL